MMRKVNPDDVEAWLAGLFLKGTLPKDRHVWWHPNKVDIPVFEIVKDVTQNGNITMIRHSLKIRFNKHGRARKLYKEWPMAIQMNRWTTEWYAKQGLAHVSENGALVTLISGNETGQAIYRVREGSDEWVSIYILEAYEGTVK